MLCTGLAILGICIPLPGHSIQDVEADGWENSGGKSEWFSSRVFASGTYRLSALVKSNEVSVVSVVVREGNERDRNDQNSPLGRTLARMCSSRNGNEVCAVGNLRFTRMPCLGGWLLLRTTGDKARARAYCEQLAPLFNDIP